jgi:hypothetical protein
MAREAPPVNAPSSYKPLCGNCSAFKPPPGDPDGLGECTFQGVSVRRGDLPCDYHSPMHQEEE